MRHFHVGPLHMDEDMTTTTVAVSAAVPADQTFRVFIDGQDMGGSLQANMDDGGWHGLPSSLKSWLKEDPNRFGNAVTANVDPTEARRAAS